MIEYQNKFIAFLQTLAFTKRAQNPRIMMFLQQAWQLSRSRYNNGHSISHFTEKKTIRMDIRASINSHKGLLKTVQNKDQQYFTWAMICQKIDINGLVNGSAFWARPMENPESRTPRCFHGKASYHRKKKNQFYFFQAKKFQVEDCIVQDNFLNFQQWIQCDKCVLLWVYSINYDG